jgi:hypothetical protein
MINEKFLRNVIGNIFGYLKADHLIAHNLGTRSPPFETRCRS